VGELEENFNLLHGAWGGKKAGGQQVIALLQGGMITKLVILKGEGENSE